MNFGKKSAFVFIACISIVTSAYADDPGNPCYLIKKIADSGLVYGGKYCDSNQQAALEKAIGIGESLISITEIAPLPAPPKKTQVTGSSATSDSWFFSGKTTDNIAVGAIGLFETAKQLSGPVDKENYTSSYSSSTFSNDIQQENKSQTSSSPKAVRNNETFVQSGYVILEEIVYSQGQKIVARGKCNMNGRKYNVEYYPTNGTSSRYYISSTSGSSIDDVSTKYCN